MFARANPKKAIAHSQALAMAAYGTAATPQQAARAKVIKMRRSDRRSSGLSSRTSGACFPSSVRLIITTCDDDDDKLRRSIDCTSAAPCRRSLRQGHRNVPAGEANGARRRRRSWSDSKFAAKACSSRSNSSTPTPGSSDPGISSPFAKDRYWKRWCSRSERRRAPRVSCCSSQPSSSKPVPVDIAAAAALATELLLADHQFIMACKVLGSSVSRALRMRSASTCKAL
mmetsp:Transcript_107408/g.256647  ORF Transcript_107408/g.256647 Transcript_107408/m.256647 type:complete len:228 (-) Transcript_107408:367-1050(-)